jgi:hypothetical protein
MQIIRLIDYLMGSLGKFLDAFLRKCSTNLFLVLKQMSKSNLIEVVNFRRRPTITFLRKAVKRFLINELINFLAEKPA